MKKNISILGSTGSIGLSTLKIIDKRKSYFKINILSANKNYNLICSQIKKYKPKVFVINDEKIFNKVKVKLKNNKTLILNKFSNKIKSFKKSDICVIAIPGIAGLEPTIKLTKLSKKMLIANKESVICGWNLIKKVAIKYKTSLIPVDSEHFSIMKILEKEKKNNVKKVYLTASGGPFLNYKLSKLKHVKPSEAIKHPKWKMGKKISVDSATLMNKLLEVIEAQKLFSLDIENIDIVIHPQSLVHAIIQFNNGLFKFIYHETTMEIPLANAIFEEDLNINKIFKRSRKDNIFFKNLNFRKVDTRRYPTFKLKSRINEHASTPIIINAVNEILVDQYLQKKIQFDSFYRYILSVLNDRNYRKYAIKEPKNIDQIFVVDKWSRKTIYEKLKKLK